MSNPRGKDAEWFQPDAPPMTKEQLEAACEGQIVYPKVVRKRVDPPIKNQTYALLSYLPLPEPVNGVYGFIKSRGTAPDEKIANDMAKKVVQKVDSKYKVLIAKVGTWVPLSDKTDYVKEDIDVKMDDDDKEEVQLNDEAVKEAERRHERIRKEIDDRTKKMLDPNDDPYADMEGMKYYVMKRTTRAGIKRYLNEIEEKKTDLLTKLEAVNKVIDELEEKHSNYPEEWIAYYNEEVRKLGLRPIKEEDDIGSQ